MSKLEEAPPEPVKPTVHTVTVVLPESRVIEVVKEVVREPPEKPATPVRVDSAELAALVEVAVIDELGKRALRVTSRKPEST